jgi:plasmid stabilization system protein ParE
MSYHVVLAENARRDLEAACAWWAKNRSYEQAQRWYTGFAAAIRSLSQNPEKHPRAHESEILPYQLRQLNYGVGRRPTHRAVFTIRDDVVVVLRVRHLAQDQLSPDNL